MCVCAASSRFPPGSAGGAARAEKKEALLAVNVGKPDGSRYILFVSMDAGVVEADEPSVVHMSEANLIGAL